MSTVAQRESSLVIEHWNSAYYVPRDHPAPHDIQHRLDDVVRGEVMEACRRRLSPLVDDSDSSVWLIRGLHLDLAFDASEPAVSRAAEYWGEQLAAKIHRAMDEGADGTTLLRFADRAAYVAQWVRDLAAGQAWSQWYYAEFNSLRSLPTGAAIAEAIVREAGRQQRILLQIAAAGALEHVLAVLHENDAGKIFRAVAPDLQVNRNGAAWVERIVEICKRTPLAGGPGFAHDALRLYAAAKTAYLDAPEDGIGSAINAVLALRSAMAQMPPQQAHEFLSAVVSGNRAAVLRIVRNQAIHADERTLSLIIQIAEAEPDWGVALESALRTAARANPEEAFLTEWGGVFLLGPAFLDLHVDEALQMAVQRCEDPEEAAAMLRLIVAVHCLGRSRAISSISDRAVQLFAGLERAPSLTEAAEIVREADFKSALKYFDETLAEDRRDLLIFDEAHAGHFALDEVLPELELASERADACARIAAAVLRLFAVRLPGFARSSPEYLLQNFLTGTSEIQCTESRIDVRLPRSPLAVVLQIAGAYRSYELPWRKGVEICLHAPSA